jgi:hypothetical protein
VQFVDITGLHYRLIFLRDRRWSALIMAVKWTFYSYAGPLLRMQYNGKCTTKIALRTTHPIIVP